MRKHKKRKLKIMGGLGILMIVLYYTFCVIDTLLDNHESLISAWEILFYIACVAFALAPVYLRIGNDHTLDIPSRMARRHHCLLLTIAVLVLTLFAISFFINDDHLYKLNSLIFPSLCGIAFLYDLTGYRYPAIIISGALLFLRVCDFVSNCTVFSLELFVDYTLQLAPYAWLFLHLLLRHKYHFLHWIGFAVSCFVALECLMHSIVWWHVWLIRFHFLCASLASLLQALGFWLENDRAELHPARSTSSSYPALEAYKRRLKDSTKQKG